MNKCTRLFLLFFYFPLTTFVEAPTVNIGTEVFGQTLGGMFDLLLVGSFYVLFSVKPGLCRSLWAGGHVLLSM